MRLSEQKNEEMFQELPLCQIKEMYEHLPGGKEFLAELQASPNLRSKKSACAIRFAHQKPSLQGQKGKKHPQTDNDNWKIYKIFKSVNLTSRYNSISLHVLPYLVLVLTGVKYEVPTSTEPGTESVQPRLPRATRLRGQRSRNVSKGRLQAWESLPWLHLRPSLTPRRRWDCRALKSLIYMCWSLVSQPALAQEVSQEEQEKKDFNKDLQATLLSMFIGSYEGGSPTYPPWCQQLRVRNLSDKAVAVASGLANCGLANQEASLDLFSCGNRFFYRHVVGRPWFRTWSRSATKQRRSTTSHLAIFWPHILCTLANLSCIYNSSQPSPVGAMPRIRKMVFMQATREACLAAMKNKKEKLEAMQGLR